MMLTAGSTCRAPSAANSPGAKKVARHKRRSILALGAFHSHAGHPHPLPGPRLSQLVSSPKRQAGPIFGLPKQQAGGEA
jgi:hypothetical protein